MVSRGQGRGQRGGTGGRGGRGGGRGGRGGSSYAGPKLPSTLLDQVDSTYGVSKRGSAYGNRKDDRKAARQEKKSRQPTRYSPEEDSEEEEEDPQPVPKPSSKALGKRPVTGPESPPKKKRKLPELTLPGAKDDDAEDQEIEWLEWMLKKEKAKAKEDDLDDGLDDFADIIGPGGSGLQGEEDDLGLSEEEDFDESDEEDDDEVASGDDVSDDALGSDDEEEDAADVSDGHSMAEDDLEKQDAPTTSETSGTESAAPPQKYIPPHMRAAALAEKAAGDVKKVEERRKLDRKVQGCLNKLSEANIDGILAEVEQLYRDYSRNDVTTSLTSAILVMISSRSNLLDSFVILYATFVGALHRIIGMEFGAHFVHTLVTRYHTLTIDPSASTILQANMYETPDASKEALNLLTLITELYNAGVIASGLIYDLIRGFLGTEGVMSETAVESLLKVLRCSGSQLRTDDSSSLKDIVGIVQDKAKGNEKVMTTRARFMVETLVNVKNGKGKLGSGAEQSNEAAQRMKKYLSGLGRKRRLLTAEPLRASLSDLLTADSKGKWWMVGAGWAGNPLVEKPLNKPVVIATNEEEALVELARKQGMNTDVRRSVFVVLLTSEDYMHACDRLNQLRLTDVQQREFIRVALHCCGLEKRYNPYYTLIINNLCAESYDHRFTLQYALWDLLRDMDRARGVNVAKAMAYIIARGSMDLTVFKAVEWIEIGSPTRLFLTTFLAHLLLATQTVSPLFVVKTAEVDSETIEEVFEKCLSHGEVASGWAVVIRTEMGPKKLAKLLTGLNLGELESDVVSQGLQIARGVLARAV